MITKEQAKVLVEQSKTVEYRLEEAIRNAAEVGNETCEVILARWEMEEAMKILDEMGFNYTVQGSWTIAINWY